MNNLIEEIRDKYKTTYNDILLDINGIPFPFDKSNTNIGVAVSGGADSAILLYTICYLIESYKLESKVHIINCIRNWKSKPWQSYNAKMVIEYIQNKFTNIQFQIHKNFVPPEFEWADKGAIIVDEYGKYQSGDIIELRAFSEYIAHNYNLTSWYVGVTKNPKDISDEGGMLNRSFDNLELDKIILQRDNVLVCKPFAFLEKDTIISLYNYFDAKDLLQLTRSCEGEIQGISYKNYNEGDNIPLCGECYWCRERQWGIENAK